MKAKKKEKTGSVKVELEVHKSAVEHCKKTGTLVNFFVTQAVKEKLEKESSNN